MWKVYDAILDRVDADDRIEYVRAGVSWILVRTERGAMGVASVLAGRSGNPLDEGAYRGMPLREAAGLVKSWDFEKAALGLAAVNACLNRPERFPDCGEPDAFLRYRELARGRRVAVVGRFQYLEQRLRPICELSVLERAPISGEYPDMACEYILSDMDLVFITGSTVGNKTLPRLLELTKDAYTVITGPSTPMTEALFDFGADALCGFCATWEADCLRAVEDRQGIFAGGRMVVLEADNRRGQPSI